MTATQTGSLAEEIERCVRAFDFEGLRDLYHPEALLDAHVPQWRLQYQGPDEILAWYRSAYPTEPTPRSTWARTRTAGDIVVIETETRVGEGDEEHLVREIDVYRTEGRLIVEHAHYCTGVWDPATIARQKAEAPMVRW